MRITRPMDIYSAYLKAGTPISMEEAVEMYRELTKEEETNETKAN